MGQDQIKGMVDRTILVLATWLLSKAVSAGWLSQADSAQLLPALIVLPALAWGWWNNRDKALIQSAGNVVDPKTNKPVIIVASPEMAAATPAQSNIVSNTEVKVVDK